MWLYYRASTVLWWGSGHDKAIQSISLCFWFMNDSYLTPWELYKREMCCQISRDFVVTVYPKKYAHGFCFAVLCCGFTLTDFPISIRLTSLALWQSNDCPSANKATLMNMDKYFMWINYERLHNHNKAKHNKTVCIFLGINCISSQDYINGIRKYNGSWLNWNTIREVKANKSDVIEMSTGHQI